MASRRSERTVLAVVTAAVWMAAIAGCGNQTTSAGVALSSAAPESSQIAVADATSSTTQPDDGQSATKDPASEATDKGTVRLPTAKAGEKVATAEGFVVWIDGVRDVQIDGLGPGEINGPGVAVTVHLENETGSAVNLNGAAVNAYYGSLPASPSDADPAVALDGELPSGMAASGVYVFRQPDGALGTLTVSVEHNASTDVVIVRP